MSTTDAKEVGQLRDRLNVAERNVKMRHELPRPLPDDKGLSAPDLLHSAHETL